MRRLLPLLCVAFLVALGDGEASRGMLQAQAAKRAGPKAAGTEPSRRAKLFNFTVFNGRLVFMVDYGDGKTVELWSTFGPGNTRRLETFQAAAPQYQSDVLHSTMMVFHNLLWFSAERDNKGLQLWASTGIEGGAYPLRDDEVGIPKPDHFTLYKDRLYFSAEDRDKRQLWISTGSNDNTLPITRSIGRDPADLTVCNGRLYFTGYDSPNYRELFYTFGANSARERGIFPLRRERRVGEKEDPPPACLNPRQLTVFGPLGQQQLVFAASDVKPDAEEEYTEGPRGRQLWATPGSENLLLLTDPERGGLPDLHDPTNLTLFQGKLYFTALNKRGRAELWYTAGHPNSTYRIRAFECMMMPRLPLGFRSSALFVFQNKLWFGAQASDFPTSDGKGDDVAEDRFVQGMQLWSCTGAKGVVAPIFDRKGEECLDPASFTPFAGKLFFSASDQFRGRQLWQTTGVRSTTFEITLGKGPGKPPGSLPDNLIRFGNALYYTVVDEDGSVDLRLTRGRARKVDEPEQETDLLIRKFKPIKAKKPKGEEDDDAELLPLPKKP